MSQTLTIKEMPISERPYEKLEHYGPEALSDAELIAIIIKNGTVKEKSTDIGMRILSKHESGILGLHYLSLKELQNIKGIGRVKAIQLKAVAELGIRMGRATRKERFNINSPETVAGLYMDRMRHLEREHMLLVLLDTKYSIIEEYTLSIGTVNASLIHPREVFIYALKKEAVNILLVHNHPSGEATPSNEDILITKRIKEAGEIVGVSLIDHIVIGDGSFCSLKKDGLL